MKKSDNKGFILAETIAVSTIVLGALVIIYTQFISINNSYYRSFKYNTVDDLYAVNNLKTYIEADGIENLIQYITNSEYTYADITSCSTDYFIEYMYCETLLETLNIKTAIFTKENVQWLQDYLKNNNIFSENMYSFIKSIHSDQSNSYRLIVEFKDDTFGTLKIDGNQE